jgi:hypothetical protein
MGRDNGGGRIRTEFFVRIGALDARTFAQVLGNRKIGRLQPSVFRNRKYSSRAGYQNHHLAIAFTLALGR